MSYKQLNCKEGFSIPNPQDRIREIQEFQNKRRLEKQKQDRELNEKNTEEIMKVVLPLFENNKKDPASIFFNEYTKGSIR